MYRVYDKEEAIRQVQIYLAVVADGDIFIAPTGVYDDNTRFAVIEFQNKNGIKQSGVVDYETFTLLYEEYRIKSDIISLNQTTGSFVEFPIYPRQFSPALSSINRMLATLLDYYGHTHSIRDNNFYSTETSRAVGMIRGIYQLPDDNYIDEILYMRLIADHDSIKGINNFR